MNPSVPENDNPQGSTPLGKRKADAEPDGVEITPPTKVPLQAAGADDLDDELQYIGRTGKNALQDFPHARENCAVKSFEPANEDKCYESCPNCHCYVCDTPVAACAEWDEHCMAQHGLQRWQTARAAAKSRGAADAAQQQQTASTSAASRQRAMLLGPDELLSAVESVHPVETPEPAGLRADVRLRPYQKQSLAFALELERSDDLTLVGREGSVRRAACEPPGVAFPSRAPPPPAARCAAASSATRWAWARLPCAPPSSSRGPSPCPSSPPPPPPPPPRTRRRQRPRCCRSSARLGARLRRRPCCPSSTRYRARDRDRRRLLRRCSAN